IRQSKQGMTSLATTDLHFALDESCVFGSLNRNVLRLCVSGEQFGCVALFMRVARSSQKDARAFVFEFRSREDALAHRFLAQAGVERIGVLALDEGSETLR